MHSLSLRPGLRSPALDPARDSCLDKEEASPWGADLLLEEDLVAPTAGNSPSNSHSFFPLAFSIFFWILRAIFSFLSAST